jgi:peptide/nickel transport system ATP-binding protein
MTGISAIQSSAADVILSIKDLSLQYNVYGGSLKVLDSVNLDLWRSGSVGLVGESGCGKTTTLKSLLKILPPAAEITSGSAYYNGEDIFKMNHKKLQEFRRKGAGMIFQDPTAALNPVFTIGDQLISALKYTYSGKVSKKELKSVAIEALSSVSLPDPDRILNNYPFQLSGGMRQRVCIAMALAAGKKVLLADEPGTSLDVTIQDQILRLIKQLVEDKGLSVVMVSHSLGVIREVTSYVYVMYAGTIVEKGITGEVFNRPLHPYTIALLSCIPKLTGKGIAKGIPGRIPDYLNPPAGCRFSPRCNHAIDRCRSERPNLIGQGDGHSVACFIYDR